MLINFLTNQHALAKTNGSTAQWTDWVLQMKEHVCVCVSSDARSSKKGHGPVRFQPVNM